MTRDEVKRLEAKAIKSNTPLVLIIEDKLSEQRFFSLVEKAVGMVSCVVSDGPTALRVLKYAHFDLIMLDLHMPDIKAIECANEIRLMERLYGGKTPIIAVTANAMIGDRQKCLDAGMDDYLAKPFPLTELKEMIAQWAA